jgi:hypothetical protein
MTAPRVRCPAADLWGARHMIADRRWVLRTPDGEEIALCSAACVLSWICYALPAAAEQSRHDGEAA